MTDKKKTAEEKALDDLLVPDELRDVEDSLAGTIGELTPDILRGPEDFIKPKEPDKPKTLVDQISEELRSAGAELKDLGIEKRGMIVREELAAEKATEAEGEPIILNMRAAPSIGLGPKPKPKPEPTKPDLDDLLTPDDLRDKGK